MMSNKISVLPLYDSPDRWENAAERVKNLPGSYIYFASRPEQFDPERIAKMLLRSFRSAELIVPVKHTQFPQDEILETPLLLPQHSIFEWFRCPPMLNGKLMKKKFLLECLENNPHDWLHSPCPDLFLLLFCPAKTGIVRMDFEYDAGTFRRFMGEYRKASEWLFSHPDFSLEEKFAMQSRITQYEDYLTDTAVEINLPDEEIFRFMSVPAVIHNYFTEHPQKLHRCSLPKQPCRPGKIRCLAVFCSSLRSGGAERCASLLLQHFAGQTDWHICLFLDSALQPGDYPCPEKVETVILPGDFYARHGRLLFLLKEKQVDTCLFFDHFLKNFYLDILTAMQLGLRTIAMEHSTFSFPLFSGDTELIPLRRTVYPAVSVVTCLSRSDELIWRQLGINARYVPNPLTFDTSARPPFSERKNKVLIFIARMTPYKGVLDALKAVEIVKVKHPDVKLLMLGSFPDPDFEREVKTYISGHDLTDQVELTGFAKVEDYIGRASIHLMPSSVEGYPMTLMEAKSYGIPTVAYSMPYLEAGKEEYGTLMVRQQDHQAMAEKISELFDDFSRLNELGRKAWNSLEKFDDRMVFSCWKQLFDQLEAGGSTAPLSSSGPPEKQLDLLKIQMNEILNGISSMQHNPLYRRKILNEEMLLQKKNNILFGSVLRIYLTLRQRFFAKENLPWIWRRFLQCLWQFKKIYRKIRPWQEEE